MSNKVEDIDIKNHTYYFFNDIINIENLIRIILKWKRENHAKIFLSTILDM